MPRNFGYPICTSKIDRRTAADEIHSRYENKSTPYFTY
jgi:hypothetical protein